MSVILFLWGLTSILAGLVVYHHGVFPVVMRALARRTITTTCLDPRTADSWPTVSIIVPAYREAQFIAGMVQNLAALDYPRDKLDIVIACDGSDDGTPELAQVALATLGTSAIRIEAFRANRGKVGVLNAMIAQAKGEIVLLLDASSAFAPDLVQRVVVPFADHHVGVVCPAYGLGAAEHAGEATYWRYQSAIKRAEADFAEPMGAHGAGYALRRSLWKPLAASTINDDFVLPMQIVAQGFHARYLPDLIISERDISQPEQDRARRRRLGAGNMQQVLLCHPLAWACGWRTAFVFLSGKVLRALMPALMLAALVSSTLLAWYGGMVFAAMPLLIQLALYALAGLAELSPALRRLPGLSQLHYLVSGYAAMGLGLFDLVRGRFRDERRPQVTQQDVTAFAPPATEMYKRAFDLVIGAIAFAAFVVLTPFIALAIRLDSKGPIFYRQLRVGRALPDRTELFYLIKFRTMRVDAESASGAVWASKADPRVTRLGRFMRKTRIDELPQCVNVLLGDMSIVGPRPERPAFFAKLEGAIPFYVERTYGLKPGVTGLAQVSTGYDATIDDVRLKILFDHSYALRIRSPLAWLKTDLAIVFKTFLVMGLGMGR